MTVGAEMGVMRQGEGNGISINGGRPESNNYTIDGLGASDVALSTPAVILSLDAIQELQVESDTYSAEYGFSANQVNIVSKGGTNQLHGTLFEFDRNDAFDSRSPIGQPTLPTLRQNQFGFVVGGPVILPHLYDGRNKTFFMANYEGTRIRNGFTGFANAPPPTELAGDFSGTGYPEPGTAACAAALAQNLPCNPENPLTGLAFPGDKIPSSMFSNQAQVVLAANTFPVPNCNPANCAGNNVLAVSYYSQHGQPANLPPGSGPREVWKALWPWNLCELPEHKFVQFGFGPLWINHLLRDREAMGHFAHHYLPRGDGKQCSLRVPECHRE